MKNLLKYAVVLLLLITLIGTASAAVSNVSAVATANMTNTGNYDVEVTWDSSLESPEAVNFNVSVGLNNQDPYNRTTNDTSYTFTDLSLTPGNYTVQVVDNTGGSNTTTFEILPAPLDPPIITDFHAATEAGSETYNLTWNWTQEDSNITLEFYNGTGFVPVTGMVTVQGNVSNASTFTFRLNDTVNKTFSSNFTTTFNPITFQAPEITATSLTWNFTAPGWSAFNYEVSKGGELVTSTTLDAENGTVTAENLEPNTEYTLTIYGTSNADGYGNGLQTTNSSTTTEAAVDFIDDIVSNRNVTNSTGEPIPFSIETGTTLSMNVTATEEVTFSWELEFNNGTGGWEDVPAADYEATGDATHSNFSWRPAATGEYRLTLNITNGSGSSSPTQSLSWQVDVTPRSTGSRIWEEGMPTTYTWDARSFAGFYYDIDTGQGSEFMRIENIDNVSRTIDRGDIFYTTTTSDVDFEYDGWGSYQIVGFMGDKYYAGSGSDSLMREGYLSKVLIDESESNNYRVGQSIALEEGYSVRIDQINTQGSSAYLVIEKDGRQVGEGIVNTEGSGTQRGTFTYNRSISGNVNVPIIRIHVNSVFMGTESSMITVNGIFQVSDNMTRLQSGTVIDKMEIQSVSGDTITMTNDERISLSQDSNVTLMGQMKFVVADSPTLRFAPTLEYTNPGTYEIRGTVSDYSDADYIIYDWDPTNFEGFYYDINDDVGSSEKIHINQTLDDSSRTIDRGNLQYTSSVKDVTYNFSAWGEYAVVGFMGEKYFAGENGSLLRSGNLSKVLMDTDDTRNMQINQELVLEEGYSVRVEQINTNGSSAYLQLYKDGRAQGNGMVVQAGQDFEYERRIANNNTTFIKVRVSQVFMGTESSIVTIAGIFQASENLTRLESGAEYGRMKMDSYNQNGIVLSSDERITLSSGDNVNFMQVGNETMYFKVGDNSTLRFAPVVERQVGSTDPLNITLSPSNATVGDVVRITVNDRGTTIEGVTVYVNGSNIGTTNSSGQINFTTNATGTYRVVAEKSGFVNGTASLTVQERLTNMTVRVSPETIYFGTTGTIRATDSLNGSAIADATVYISGENVGRTNASGEFNYTFNNTGSVTVNVVKQSYNNGTTTVNVSQEVAFAYSNFTMRPEEPSARSNIRLSFDVVNNGIRNGSHDLSLILTDSNGTVVDQANSSVSVNTGQTRSVSLSVKAPEQGTYNLTLRETDSNRTIDLPSGMSTVSVGEARFGSTILYIVLAVLAVIVIAVVGFVAYLFGVRGATKDNYREVAQEVVDDMKSKFQRK